MTPSNRPTHIATPIQAPTTIEWKNPRTKVITKGRYQETITMDPFERPLVKDKVDTHTNEHIMTKTEYDGEGRTTYQSDPMSTGELETGTKTTLDGLGRTTQVTHTGDGSTTAYTYEGDKVLVTRPNGFKTQGRYRIFGDPKNKELIETSEQITKEAWKTTTLTRDKLGNITSIKQGPITRLFQFEKDRPKLLQRQYDPEIGWINYAYDGVGNKTSEALEGKEAINYAYDGLNGNNHRTVIQQGKEITYTIHNQAGQLLVEYTPNQSKTYLYHNHQLMARIDKTGNQEAIHYYHTDILGSPIAQSDSKGNLEWQEDYAPFGKRLLKQGKDNGQWYTGKTEDEATGFVYLNARYYDPEIARFISPDPVHFKEKNPFSFNRYAYVANNPMRWVDPKGLTRISVNLRQGMMVVDPEQLNRDPYTMSITSGRGNCMNNPSCIGQKNIGPIPLGNYIINSSKVSDPGFFGDLYLNRPKFLRGGDWGDWNVPLEPQVGTKTFGRSGFYLHGGSFKGSAGCVDFGGGIWGNSATNQLQEDLFLDLDSKIPVNVYAK